MREIGETAQEALVEVRLLLFQLRPQHLEEQGLARALQSRLRAVEARAGLMVEFDCAAYERLPAETEHELYRLAQEALNNVVKHAHARTIAVRLGTAAQTAKLEIVEDGIGFDASRRARPGGFGLSSMRERAAHVAGVLHLESAPGSGTRVHVEVPR